jgi:hypothetical protein
MSDNVESLIKCTLCSVKYPLEGWKAKPNGELYRTCETCRLRERDAWRKKALNPEFNERVRVLQKENYHTEQDYQKRCLRVKCPDCDKEMGVPGLRAHVKNKSCKGRKPEV